MKIKTVQGLEPFKTGTKVNIWVELQKVKRQAMARIISHEVTRFISVDWMDGTYSEDMLPSDFVGLGANDIENMTKKSKLKACWDDGNIYNCIFLSSQLSFTYKVSVF